MALFFDLRDKKTIINTLEKISYSLEIGTRHLIEEKEMKKFGNVVLTIVMLCLIMLLCVNLSIKTIVN